MVAYTYSRVSALNFNTTPASVAKSATGQVYAIADTTFTTPLTVTMVVGGTAATSLSSDANGFFPDFTVADRTSVVWKQNSSSFTTVLTTTDPVPGAQGSTGAPGTPGVKGDRGDLATWQTNTFYPLNQIIANPSGDLVKVTTAHTSGTTYDGTKFGWVNNNAANLTGTLPEATLPGRLSDTSLSATYVPKWKPSTAYLAGDAVLNPSGDTVTAIAGFTSGTTYDATKWNLSPTYPAKAASPRTTSRVKLERKPVMLVDRVSPNATWGDLTLLSVSNSSMYAVGADRTLRSSSTGGAAWAKLAQGGTGMYGRDGMFFRTSTAGTIITTWHPDGGGAPTIRRSTNYGATFADVVVAQTDVDYLGPTNVCQDPVTGYIYIIEYVTATAAAKATFKIIRSIDNGATWTDFHTFQRDAVAFPTTAVRHGHGIQWDQHGQRIYFLTGDAENACGIYRVNAAGTGIEAVLRKDSQTAVSAAATAVGIMFFPNYIAWGQDQTADAWLLRMNRSQIGAATPVVERIMHVQSCAWYTVRTKADGTEWLMGVSNQHSADVPPLDNMIHLYRVADDGATCDEVAAIPATSLTATNYFYPLDTPLQANDDEYVWLGSNIYNPFEGLASTDPHIGQQLKVSLGWGMQSLIRPDAQRKPYAGTPQTQNSSKVTLAASAIHTFGATRVPNGARKLYVFDIGAWKITGTGTVKTRVWNATGAAAVADPIAGNIETTSQSVLYNTLNNESAPNVFVSGQLTAGNMIYFDIMETGGTAGADAVGYVQFAWGY